MIVVAALTIIVPLREVICFGFRIARFLSWDGFDGSRSRLLTSHAFQSASLILGNYKSPPKPFAE